MALDYLEIKSFPSDITPIMRGGLEVVAWWRTGQLAERKEDALLVAVNAGAYAAGLGADWLGPDWLGPPLIGNGSEESKSDAIANDLESKIVALVPTDDGSVQAINPLLMIQIAQLIYQLIKSLKN